MNKCTFKGYCKYKDTYKHECKINDFDCEWILDLKKEQYKIQIMLFNFIEKISNFFKKSA